MKVKIYGAGSIGNHLANRCRAKNWQVLMCDTDASALERTKNDIYPSRYGSWDDSIELCLVADAPNHAYDLVIIGTPPDTHIDIALQELAANPPRAILMEKPICTPSLANAQKLVDVAKKVGTLVSVGYNHVLTENSVRAEQLLNAHTIGNPITISAKFREHWGGIFGAHPWLNGPKDSYLGFYERGGGASGEHSHAINIWQHFAHICNMGRIVEVSAEMDMVSTAGVNYDRICLLNVKTERGFIGDIAQDVVTEPAQKMVRIQADNGFIEWIVNHDSNHDSVRLLDAKGKAAEELIAKTRPQDFQGEIDHLEALLTGNPATDSPISLTRGLDTMLVVAAAHRSFKQGRKVKINYDAGYSTDALEVN